MSFIIKKEILDNIELIREFEDPELENLKTDPSKGIISPSKKVTKDICEKEKFCKEQGPITFGQLRSIVEAAQKKNLVLDIGEGFYKAILRLFPWFFPQIAIAGFVGSSIRAFNKIIKPGIEETRGYKHWWGKVTLKIMTMVEGDINPTDPISKIFFISDGLLNIMDRKVKLKFARYIAELASTKPDNEPVPEFFVENELRNWLNKKFLLNPPLSPKTINESEYDDLKWIDDVPSFYMPNVGDRVEVENLGDYRAYLSWLGDYRDDYQNGIYGENIRGVVDAVDPDERIYVVPLDFNGKLISGEIIVFPYGGYINYLSERQFTGLDIRITPLNLISESENDDGLGWIRDIPKTPNYNGIPQGVVYVRSIEEVDRVLDILEEYNGETSLRGGSRDGFYPPFNDPDDDYYVTEGISISFFVETPDNDKLRSGYWRFFVDEDGINDWLSDGEVYSTEYEIYKTIEEFEYVFKNIHKK